MAAKPKASAKPKQPSQNTSAATEPGNKADVSPKGTSVGASAPEAAQVASQAIAPQAGQSSSDEAKGITPKGGAKQAPAVTHLLVVAKKEGFRRAGRAWSAAETKVAVDEFTDQQILDLAAEPMLDVVFVAESE